MPSHEPRTPRRLDWIVSAVILALLAMLFSPALAQNVGDARRNTCLNHCKMISFALLYHETAHKYFPAASTAEWSVKPGNDGDTERAGYSWHTLILPFLEQQKLYAAIQSDSPKLEKAPLAVRIAGPNGEVVAATTPIESFLCPEFAGTPVVDITASGYKAGDGGAPALTNYLALSASHLVKDGAGKSGLGGGPSPNKSIQGDGVLAFFSKSALDSAGSFVKLLGVSQAGIRDGTSNTLVFSESREQTYAAWIDGQVSWVVAAWPQNPEGPRLLKNAIHPEAPDALGWAQDQKAAVVSPLTKQRFGISDDEAGVYLPQAMWSGGSDRKFGPSGNHAGVAMHAFADGHCKGIVDTIDATVYVHLTTRAGREMVEEGAF
jgi:hypothetical protein